MIGTDLVLAKIDQGRLALSEARTLSGVKQVADIASAMETYSRRQKLGEEAERYARELRLDAERKMGELLRSTPNAKPGPKQELGTGLVPNSAPSLAQLGIDKKTSSRAQRLANIPDASFAAVKSGSMAMEAAFKEAKRESGRNVAELRHAGGRVDDLAALAERGVRVGTVYADPPWIYGNQSTRGATGDHYVGLSVDEICALPVANLAAENAHLHLWTTNAFLFESQRVIEAWGFEYRSCYVWVKPQIGMGNYWRVSHEFLLLGIRGSVTFTDKSLRSWGEFRRGKHSAKPEEIRQLIERVSPPGPRLEMFARREAPGWLSFGNEIERSLLDQGEAA